MAWRAIRTRDMARQAGALRRSLLALAKRIEESAYWPDPAGDPTITIHVDKIKERACVLAAQVEAAQVGAFTLLGGK